MIYVEVCKVTRNVAPATDNVKLCPVVVVWSRLEN